MFTSRCNTVLVPIIATNLAGAVAKSPAIIIENAGYDSIVRLRNNSFGQFVLLAFDAATLQAAAPRTDTFKLPAGATESIPIAKGQSLYASTTSGPIDGAGAELSWWVYDGVPIEERS